jgi:hypothetical protein
LLPYYEDLGLEKIHGVNCLEPKHNNSNADKACSFICSVSENPTNCLCKYGIKVNLFDKKMYCYYHNKTINTTHLLQIKEAKQKLKDEKQKTKDEKQKTKDEKQKTKEAKQKTKELKQQLKEETQKLKEEKLKATVDAQNTIVIPIIIGEENVVVPCGCIATLKTGARKGNVCNKRVYNDSMCKLHYCIFVIK